MTQRKTADVRLLEGNPGKRPLKTPLTARGEPLIPDYLSTPARECLETVLSSMPAGTYSAADSFHLAAFASAWALHREAVTKLASEGALALGSQGQPVQSPWLRIANQQAQLLSSLGDRLGLGPKARAGLDLPEQEKPRGKFEGLLGGIQMKQTRSR